MERNFFRLLCATVALLAVGSARAEVNQSIDVTLVPQAIEEAKQAGNYSEAFLSLPTELQKALTASRTEKEAAPAQAAATEAAPASRFSRFMAGLKGCIANLASGKGARQSTPKPKALGGINDWQLPDRIAPGGFGGTSGAGGTSGGYQPPYTSSPGTTVPVNQGTNGIGNTGVVTSNSGTGGGMIIYGGTTYYQPVYGPHGYYYPGAYGGGHAQPSAEAQAEQHQIVVIPLGATPQAFRELWHDVYEFNQTFVVDRFLGANASNPAYASAVLTLQTAAFVIETGQPLNATKLAEAVQYAQINAAITAAGNPSHVPPTLEAQTFIAVQAYMQIK